MLQNYFKKVKEKGDQVSGLLCPKLSELLYGMFSNSLQEYQLKFIELTNLTVTHTICKSKE